MNKYLVIALIFSLGCAAPPVGKGTINQVFYDETIKDSFEVRVDDYTVRGNKGQYKTILFYFDAELKSGKQLREFFEHTPPSQNTLLIGISHYGNYRKKRRRDFMNSNNGIKHLLDASIIPFVKKNFGWAKERIVVGHSFGGLWVYKKFFDAEDTTFTTFIAVSPSLWYNKADEKKGFPTSINKSGSKLYMYWGENEVFNYVRRSCRKVNSWMATDSLFIKTVYFKELKGKSHNTTMQPALKFFFENK